MSETLRLMTCEMLELLAVTSRLKDKEGWFRIPDEFGEGVEHEPPQVESPTSRASSKRRHSLKADEDYIVFKKLQQQAADADRPQ